MKYNKQQQEVIRAIDGPVMVLSCAGSGKTSVILERTRQILASGVPAAKILVATFSKAAAQEMRSRFAAEGNAPGVQFSTIHSVCYRILAQTQGLRPDAVIKLREKTAFFTGEYMRLKKGHGKNFTAEYRDIGEFYKDMALSVSWLADEAYREPQLQAVDLTDDLYLRETYEKYCGFKKATGKIDFDDMIIECHRLLTGNLETLADWQNQLSHILIDEYQDTSVLQAEIFFLLAKDRNICVVGDDDQSIYGFRNADSRIFRLFQKRYPDTRQITMTVNYRSKPRIVQTARQLIEHNRDRFPKNFTAFREGDAVTEALAAGAGAEQAARVIGRIRAWQEAGVPLREIAVLYRIKRTASILCSQLLGAGIPFYTKEPPEDIHHGMVFQDILAYWRLASGRADRTDLPRIINRPSRFIRADLVADCNPERSEVMRRLQESDPAGPFESLAAAVNTLFDHLNQMRGLAPAAMVAYLKNRMGYRDALVELAEFLETDSRGFTDDLEALELEAQRYPNMEEWQRDTAERRQKMLAEMEDNREKAIHLSTFHSAKGLEWDRVIVLSANEGVTPYLRDGRIPAPEEERRLFYVAVTRARDELVLSHGEGAGLTRSRYIDEMNLEDRSEPSAAPKSLRQEEHTASPRTQQKRRPPSQPKSRKRW